MLAGLTPVGTAAVELDVSGASVGAPASAAAAAAPSADDLYADDMIEFLEESVLDDGAVVGLDEAASEDARKMTEAHMAAEAQEAKEAQEAADAQRASEAQALEEARIAAEARAAEDARVIEEHRARARAARLSAAEAEYSEPSDDVSSLVSAGQERSGDGDAVESISDR